MEKRILIVSDNDHVIEKLSTVSEFLGKDVIIANSVESAVDSLTAESTVSSCLVSLKNPETERQMAQIRHRHSPNVPLYIIRSEEVPVITPPPPGVEVIRLQHDHSKMLRILQTTEAEVSVAAMPASTRVRLTGESPEILRVRQLVNHVSATDANVLLLGESGTCLLYTSPSPRDGLLSRMPSSA